MTPPKKNPIVALFASVELALFLIFCLAATSIIGTLIPQNNIQEFYIEKYGLKTANLLRILDIPDMYNSWWFIALLALFSLNLMVCSLERIPQVIRTIRRDGLMVRPEQLEKFPFHQMETVSIVPGEAILRVTSLFHAHGWTTRAADKDNGRLLFAEKGAWTRFGVYVVHCSILIILTGAVVGSSTVAHKILRNPHFAFKGSVMLPETETADHVTAFKSGERLGLGFTVRCDRFTIEFYPNGMPKTYRSRVTVIDGGQSVLSTDIEVNRPLTYKGVTFYQSSYQPFQRYTVALKKQGAPEESTTVISPAKQMDWREAGVSYGIINRESQGEITRRLKVWFSDNQGEPSTFWVNVGQEAIIERPSGKYQFRAQQVYATGLQVAKDPGVWLVYGGCLLMLVGLYIAFFLSHRKIYAFIQPGAEGTNILFAGEANKNKVGFSEKFSELISKLEK
ncbi:MAG: cytochrome c biogenesis protein ResB [Desulfobulbaceae bacterium]|nr:cytochrome c biogenesis protein ResB [Desulfobulbaceae bacterium]